MRRIPGVRRLVVAQALTVRMTKHSGSLRTTRPVLAGHVFVGRESGAVWLRTSENIVTVRIARVIITIRRKGTNASIMAPLDEAWNPLASGSATKSRLSVYKLSTDSRR